MKKTLLLITGLVLVIITVVAAGCDTLTPPSTTKTSDSGLNLSGQNTGIWVTGEGTVSVVPDISILSLGVEVQADTVAAAQSQAATSMDAVVRELKNKDVSDKDIRTQQYNIYPVRRWVEEKGQEILVGYRVNNTVIVKVREVENIGAIIDAATRAGGDYTRINSISFTVEDPSEYRKEAREKAMADAQAKGKQLAEAGGARLGGPTYINESGGAIPVPRELTTRSFAEAAAPATSISPGEMEISVIVQVVYSIR